MVEFDDGHGPFGYVGVERNAGHFEVKSFYFVEYFDRVAEAEWPVFELPLFALGEHGHDTIPVLRGQFVYIVDYFELLTSAVFFAVQNDFVFFERVLILQRFSFVFRVDVPFNDSNTFRLSSSKNFIKYGYLKSLL